MEKSTQKEEVKYGVNKAHIHGYIDSLVVFKNEGGNQHAALANVTSIGDTYTNKEGKQIKERDHHRIKILITDADLKAYEQIAADCKEKAANKGVDGFEPKNHTITLDNARMVNEDRKFDKESDETYKAVQFLVTDPKNVKLDTPQEKGAQRNWVELQGNVGRLHVDQEHKLANGSVCINYRPKEGEEQKTWVNFSVDGKNPYAAAAFKAMSQAEVGDKVGFKGRMVDDGFDPQNRTKRGDKIEVISGRVLLKKQDQKQAVEQAAAPKQEQKPAPKPVQTPVEKPAQTQKRTPNKGRKM